MRNHRAYLHQAVANEARNFHDLWETTHTNARNNNTIYYTDAFGNTIRIDEKNGSSTYSTDYDYNVMGELVKVTDDADNVTDIEYDRAGRKTEMTDPDMGEWAYTYDPGGNLKTQTDARSKVLWFDYDAINRLKEVRDTGSTGTRLVTRSYDPTGHKGYPAAATSHTPKGDVVVTYDTYDTRHRLTRQEWDIPGDAGGDFTQTWTYNNDNTIATTRYPAGPDGSLGETITYTHSSTHGMLTKIEGDETIASSIDYNSFGAVSDWVTGTTDTVTREVLYDDQRRPKQWKATRDSDSKNLLNLTNAAYDDNNNLERLTDLSGGNTTE
ncbi:MAG: RHS repeat protein, partial [Armatimonadetes bacterium]